MTQGYTLWKISDGDLYVYSCDDYIVLSDFVSVGPGPEGYALLSAENLKALELALRDQDVVIDLAEDIPFEPATEAILGVYNEAQSLVHAKDHPRVGSDDSRTFAVSPDRLRKLSLVHPRKGYPLDFRYCGDYALCFRYGPSVRGVIMPLDRKILLEKFTGEEVWK